MATAARYSRAIKDLALKVQANDGLADGLEDSPGAAAPKKEWARKKSGAPAPAPKT